ncbi:MAG: hypothetical protein BWX50_01209 [Euryarchaeota archaeon ADurb.Bin009]|nr:MAG: hypothetical protein BWX50_01209 [Euryarchaeota archaeon ADurb.Bin009]
MHPVPGRDLPGVDPVVQDHRRAPLLEELLHLPRKRRVAPVEPDHQPVLRLAVCPDHPPEPFGVRCKRFLHEDVFAGGKRIDRHRSVEIVSGRYQHRIDPGIVEDRAVVGRAVGKPVLLCDRLRREPRRGRDTGKVHREPGEVRVEGALGVDSGADAPDRPRPGRHLPRNRPGEAGDGAGGARAVRAILQQDADVPLSPGTDQVVGLRRAIEREGMGDQAVEVDPLLPHQFKERLHVPPLRPPDVDRVVYPPLLVVSVVASGAVGPGDDDLRLFLVEDIAGHVHPHVPDDDDPALIPDQAARGLDRGA